MNTLRYFAVGSALALTLTTTAPVFAHTDGKDKEEKDHKIGLHLGSILKDWHKENSKNQKTETHRASVSGTLSALAGSTLTIAGENGVTYAVNAADAKISGSTDVAAQLAKFRVGDKLVVRGSVVGSTVTAVKVSNASLSDREALAAYNGVRTGTVTAISGNTITIDRFGQGSTSVITNANTFFLAGGSAASSSALKLGSHIVVLGPTTTGTTDSISASVVFLISNSVSFLKGMFH